MGSCFDNKLFLNRIVAIRWKDKTMSQTLAAHAVIAIKEHSHLQSTIVETLSISSAES
jgi:hypothetical protein